MPIFSASHIGGALAASGVLSPRGGGAALKAQAELTGGNLGAVSQSVAGARLVTGPFDVAFSVEGEGLSPPGVVAGLSGKGTLSLGAGTLLALNPGPLRRVAAKAAKTKIKATKAEIEADTETVRRTLTKGIYKYAPAQIPFEVKNGTLRLAPTMLTTAGAERFTGLLAERFARIMEDGVEGERPASSLRIAERN